MEGVDFWYEIFHSASRDRRKCCLFVLNPNISGLHSLKLLPVVTDCAAFSSDSLTTKQINYGFKVVKHRWLKLTSHLCKGVWTVWICECTVDQWRAWKEGKLQRTSVNIKDANDVYPFNQWNQQQFTSLQQMKMKALKSKKNHLHHMWYPVSAYVRIHPSIHPFTHRYLEWKQPPVNLLNCRIEVFVCEDVIIFRITATKLIALLQSHCVY